MFTCHVTLTVSLVRGKKQLLRNGFDLTKVGFICTFWFSLSLNIFTLKIRGSSELVLLASQLTKPLKVKRPFSFFGLFPEPLTRGPQRYRFKAGKYEFNPNHNKSNLLVTSILTKAFKMAVIRQAIRMLFTVILNYHDGLLLNCLRVVEETDCRPTDWLCYEFFWREILLLDSTPQGMISPLW